MAGDWDDRDRGAQGRGWDDNRSYEARDARGGRAGDFPSQYSGMGGSRTDSFGQRQFERGDRGYGGGSRMSGWRPDWDPQDQDRYDHSRGRWEAQGAGGMGSHGAQTGGQQRTAGFGGRQDYGSYGSGRGGFDRRPSFGEGGLSGYGGSQQSRGDRHDHDEAYLSWREQQMQALDRDYDEFRRHRQDSFNHEFDEWRKSRGGAGSAAASYSGAQSGGSGEQSERDTTQRPNTTDNAR